MRQPAEEGDAWWKGCGHKLSTLIFAEAELRLWSWVCDRLGCLRDPSMCDLAGSADSHRSMQVKTQLCAELFLPGYIWDPFLHLPECDIDFTDAYGDMYKVT